MVEYKKGAEVKEAIDRMQLELQCCGEDSLQDWLEVRVGREK